MGDFKVAVGGVKLRKRLLKFTRAAHSYIYSDHMLDININVYSGHKQLLQWGLVTSSSSSVTSGIIPSRKIKHINPRTHHHATVKQPATG